MTINIKDFDLNLLKIDKKSYKNIDICCIGYITLKSISYYSSIISVNPLYFIISEEDGYIKEQYGNKYWILASTDKNKKVLEKCTELWNKIKSLIDKIDDKPGEYGKSNSI